MNQFLHLRTQMVTQLCMSTSSIHQELCTLKFNCNVLSIVLFKEVEKITGILTSLQMLTYGMHFLRPDVPLNRYQLQDGCIIDLSVRDAGGARSDTGSYHCHN